MDKETNTQKNPGQPAPQQPPRPPQFPANFPKPPMPEPLQMPKPGPKPLTIPRRSPMPDIRPPQRMSTRPHVFLKISSYKEIMGSLEEMNKQVGKIRNIVREFSDISRQEDQKLRVFADVISKLNEKLLKVEGIFTDPEE